MSAFNDEPFDPFAWRVSSAYKKDNAGREEKWFYISRSSEKAPFFEYLGKKKQIKSYVHHEYDNFYWKSELEAEEFCEKWKLVRAPVLIKKLTITYQTLLNEAKARTFEYRTSESQVEAMTRILKANFFDEEINGIIFHE